MPKVLQLLSPTALRLPFLEGTSNIHDVTTGSFPSFSGIVGWWLERSGTKIKQNTTQKAVTIHNVTFGYHNNASHLLNPPFFLLFQAHLHEPSTFSTPTFHALLIMLSVFFPCSIKGKLTSVNSNATALVEGGQGILPLTVGLGRGPKSGGSPAL